MLQSFIDIPVDSEFPIQNLPYGVFVPKAGGAWRVGVRIGDYVLDLAALESEGYFEDAGLPGYSVFRRSNLNTFMAQGRDVWRRVRAILTDLLSAQNPALRDDTEMLATALHPIEQVNVRMPVEVGDYTDFYSSKEHATNVGAIIRGPDNALMPNWLHVPIAYHGRASSVIVSGVDIYRPWGQIKPDDAPAPIFSPSRRVDFELEMGFIVGRGNPLGEPISVDNAAEHIFGMVLLNDWSARDIQKWEYQPLGPFLAKNFATSISPWVVTMEALEPFRCAGPVQDPEVLPYLRSSGNWAFDIQLEVDLQSAVVNAPVTVTRSNFKYLYWNICQQLAHHTVNGCNMRTGDLCGSGTISGPEAESYGSLLELTWGGQNPIEMPDGTLRRFLEDGDRVTMRGYCQGEDYRIGFGDVSARLLPAIQ